MRFDEPFPYRSRMAVTAASVFPAAKAMTEFSQVAGHAPVHDFQYHGSPVECSIDALVAEIEPPLQSTGDTLPVNPAVETRPRPIASAVHQAVLQQVIMHVIKMAALGSSVTDDRRGSHNGPQSPFLSKLSFPGTDHAGEIGVDRPEIPFHFYVQLLCESFRFQHSGCMIADGDILDVFILRIAGCRSNEPCQLPNFGQKTLVQVFDEFPRQPL